MVDVLVLCMAFDFKQFQTLIQLYTSLFMPAGSIRKELEEGEFVGELIENFNLNPLDDNPFRTRQYNLMAHTNAVTDFQNFLMKNMHAMLKEMGFEGQDPNDYHVPCDMNRMREIWEGLDEGYRAQSHQWIDGKRVDDPKGGKWAQLAFDADSSDLIDGSDPIEEAMKDADRTRQWQDMYSSVSTQEDLLTRYKAAGVSTPDPHEGVRKIVNMLGLDRRGPGEAVTPEELMVDTALMNNPTKQPSDVLDDMARSKDTVNALRSMMRDPDPSNPIGPNPPVEVVDKKTKAS